MAEGSKERGTWTRRDAFGAEGATHVASLTRPFNMFLLRSMYCKGLEGMYVLVNVRRVCVGDGTGDVLPGGGVYVC